ncbi:MAG: cyclopropane-fatty-acyl-phospholipid synthase, partial [Glaciecola sp.]
MNEVSVSRIPLLPQAKTFRNKTELARHFL